MWPAATRITARRNNGHIVVQVWSGHASLSSYGLLLLLQSVGIPDILQVQSLHDTTLGLHIFLITKGPEVNEKVEHAGVWDQAPCHTGIFIFLPQVYNIYTYTYNSL